MKEILIGSGISALGFAINYKKKLKIYDKNSSVGGHIRSYKYFNNFFDEGAHILHTKDKKIIKLLNKKKINQISKCQISNYINYKKIGYPIQNNIYDLKFYEKFKILKELFLSLIIKKKNINNYREWCISNFGNFLYENYYKKYTLKYWRTNPEIMDFKWANKRIPNISLYQLILSFFLKTKNTLVYNQFKYPKNEGFFYFYKNLYKKINVTLDHKVKKIDIKKKYIYFLNGKKVKFDKLYSTIPLPEYINIINNIPKNIKYKIKGLKYTKAITFNFEVPKKIIVKDHWCYFYDRSIECSRMSILSNIRGLKNKNYIGQIEIFRRNDEIIDLEKLSFNAQNTIIKYFKLKSSKEIINFSSKVINYAYPIPLKKNDVNTVINWLKGNNIVSFGLYGTWDFMWSDEAYNNGKKLSLNLNYA